MDKWLLAGHGKSFPAELRLMVIPRRKIRASRQLFAPSPSMLDEKLLPPFYYFGKKHRKRARMCSSMPAAISRTMAAYAGDGCQKGIMTDNHETTIFWTTESAQDQCHAVEEDCLDENVKVDYNATILKPVHRRNAHLFLPAHRRVVGKCSPMRWLSGKIYPGKRLSNAYMENRK